MYTEEKEEEVVVMVFTREQERQELNAFTLEAIHGGDPINRQYVQIIKIVVLWGPGPPWRRWRW